MNMLQTKIGHYGVFLTIFYLTLFSNNLFGFKAKENLIDSLKAALIKSSDDTTRINLLNDLAWELKEINPDTSLKISIAAIKNSEKFNFLSGLVNAFNCIGSVNFLKGNYPEALLNFEKSLEISTKLNNFERIAGVLGNMGIIYNDQGNFSKALEYYFRALKINEEAGNKKGMAINLGQIGIVFKNQRDYSKSLEYFLRALKINETLGRKPGISICLANIGIVYSRMNDFNKALEFYERAMKIDEELNNKPGISRHFGNIGNIWRNKGNFKLAYTFYSSSLKINEEIGNKPNTILDLINIGNILIANRDIKEAEKYLLRSYELSESIGNISLISDASMLLSELYEKLGNYKTGLVYYKKYINARDSIFNEESTKKSVRETMQYEFDKKEALTKMEQDKRDAIAMEELEKQRIQRNGFIVGFSLVLLLGMVSYKGYLNKKKSNLLLTHQKEIIEEKNKEITDSIKYASRIQRALITSERYIEKELKRLSKN